MEDYYNGYLLDNGVFTYMLSEKEELALNIGSYIVDNRVSIRQCSRELLVSKTRVHKLIHNELRALSSELYSCVKKQLHSNKDRCKIAYRRR